MITTTIIEWDMGHRIPFHKGKCKNIHGHRYKLEINVEGNLIRKGQHSSESMVIDFGDIKEIARTEVHDVCDHAFMLYYQDTDLLNFFNSHKNYKYIIVPFIPTAEEIAAWIYSKLNDKFKDIYKTGLKLHSIVVWETPNNKAIYSRKDFMHAKNK